MANCYRLFFVIMTGLLFAGVAQGQGVEAIQARMKERLARVDALKVAGTVGENNQGYLATAPGGSLGREDQQVVEAENADRRALYRVVAQQSGVSEAEVGTQRAARIALQARAGVWLQDADGQWYKQGSR